jgi:hypothetical protein
MEPMEVFNWIPTASSTIAVPDFKHEFAQPFIAPALDHQSLLPISIPNNRLGTLRSAALIESRVEGLFVTKRNVTDLLELPGGIETARKFTNFLAKCNELILFTGDDIDDLEEVWTGKRRAALGTTNPSTSSEIYVLMEAKTFMNNAWTIVRELTYVAVSKAAFDIIFTEANYKLQHQGLELVKNAARPCSKETLIHALRCLSGSPSQHFIAAATCVYLSLYALPERKRADYLPPVESL